MSMTDQKVTALARLWEEYSLFRPDSKPAAVIYCGCGYVDFIDKYQSWGALYDDLQRVLGEL